MKKRATQDKIQQRLSILESIDTSDKTLGELMFIVKFNGRRKSFEKFTRLHEIRFKKLAGGRDFGQPNTTTAFYLEELSKTNTEQRTVNELMEICRFDGNREAFKKLLYRYDIAHKIDHQHSKTTKYLKILSKIDTAEKTLDELSVLCDFKGATENLRKLLKQNGFAYKRKRTGPKK